MSRCGTSPRRNGWPGKSTRTCAAASRFSSPRSRISPRTTRREPSLENELRALCRAIDRLADAARHTRNNHPPHDLGDRIVWGLNQAVSSLNSLDPHLIGRRFPFHTGERSKAEPIYGALLVVIQHVERVLTLVRTIDRNVDEHLLDGLVKLETPLRPQPIA